MLVILSSLLVWCIDDLADQQDTSEPIQQDQETTMQDQETNDQEVSEEELEELMQQQQQDIPEPPEDTSEAAEGHEVVVNYIWTDEEGEVFDTTYEEIAQEEGVYQEQREYWPLPFTLGAWEMIPGFEEAVIGMEQWETKEVTIPPEEGYGEHREEFIENIPKQELEQMWIEAEEEWEILDLGGAFGEVLSITEDEVEIDFNPPMAGETMNFEITVEEINN